MTIFKYITLLEGLIKSEYERDVRNMKALENVKKLLSKVDYESEEILLNSEDKFIELLSSLKEEPLTSAEEEIAAWIIRIKKTMS